MNKLFASRIFINGDIHTLDRENPVARAVAVRDGKFIAVGTNDDIMQFQNEETDIIDLKGQVIIPGLNDSHLHLIRGGLNYNLELRWEGVPSLSDALAMLKAQADVTPAPQWVRVVGGWSEFQFAERRMPTLDEINAVSPDTPVFVLHLYDSALLNKAALRVIGYTRDTPNPPGGEIQRDEQGNFFTLMEQLKRIRLRDGGYSRGLFTVPGTQDEFMETFMVSSPAEHHRQHKRATVDDRQIDSQLNAIIQSKTVVHYLSYPAGPGKQK